MRKLPVLSSLVLLVGISVQAQIVIPGPNPQPPFQQVKAYLGLTDAQVTQIVLNLNEYGRLVSQRQQRMFQVQTEIQQETAKSPLDAAALGVRYAEIETICRNVKDEAVAVQNRNLGLLTEPQKVKLKVLEDAFKLFPIISEAQNSGVLTPPGPYPIIRWFDTSAFATPVLFPPAVLSGCQQQTIPNAAFRAGDFTFTP
jgi:hypothetical protein